MNIAKLKHLSARAMGWEIVTDDSVRGYPATFYQKPDGTRIFWQKWNPCEDLNDASALLEKVCKPNGWDVMRMSHEWPDQTNAYTARGTKGKVGTDSEGRADTAALAMTLCALRVFGIPESSITEATNE